MCFPSFAARWRKARESLFHQTYPNLSVTPRLSVLNGNLKLHQLAHRPCSCPSAPPSSPVRCLWCLCKSNSPLWPHQRRPQRKNLLQKQFPILKKANNHKRKGATFTLLLMEKNCAAIVTSCANRDAWKGDLSASNIFLRIPPQVSKFHRIILAKFKHHCKDFISVNIYVKKRQASGVLILFLMKMETGECCFISI